MKVITVNIYFSSSFCQVKTLKLDMSEITLILAYYKFNVLLKIGMFMHAQQKWDNSEATTFII